MDRWKPGTEKKAVTGVASRWGWTDGKKSGAKKKAVAGVNLDGDGQKNREIVDNGRKYGKGRDALSEVAAMPAAAGWEGCAVYKNDTT